MIRSIGNYASDKVNRVAGAHYKVTPAQNRYRITEFPVPGEDNLTDKVSISRQGSIQVQCRCNLYEGVSTF